MATVPSSQTGTPGISGGVGLPADQTGITGTSVGLPLAPPPGPDQHVGGSNGPAKPPVRLPSPPSDESVELWKVYGPTNEWGYSSPAPQSQPATGPPGQGYDAKASRLVGLRRAAAVAASNSVLTDGSGQNSWQMSVLVSAVQMDTALTGSTAQSHLTRDFYAHNFVQPSIVVTGWSLDQRDYEILCEFVHMAQHDAVENGYANLTQLFVEGRNVVAGAPTGLVTNGVDGPRTGINANRSVNLSVPMSGYASDPPGVPAGTYYNQTIRGKHQPVLAKGYISAMPRIHQQFQYAVQWQFSFTVAVMISGLYSETPAQTILLGPTWQDMLTDPNTSGFVNVTQAENKAALQYAAANSGTFFGNPSLVDTPSGGGGSGSSGSGSLPSGGQTYGQVSYNQVAAIGKSKGWTTAQINDWFYNLIPSESNGTLTDTNR